MNYGPLDLLIIQGSSFCNIDCKYCYLPNRDKKERIEFSTLQKLISSITSLDGLLDRNLSIVWHAGEPLALGIEFYENAFKLIKNMLPENISIRHYFQTNATLINDDWCSFIKRWNVRVGVSIDGPEDVHNFNRKYRNGAGSFQDCMRGIRTLKERAIEFTTISVITEYSLGKPNEIYNFISGLRPIKFGINVEEVEGINKESSLFSSGKIDAFYNFLKTMFNNYVNDSYSGFREFDSLYNAMKSKSYENLNSKLSHPLCYIVCNLNGDITTFSPELSGGKSSRHNDFIIGNVNEIDIRQMMKDDSIKLMKDEIDRGNILCRSTCEYFFLCKGGSPANKFFENGSFFSSETRYCIYTKKYP